MASPRAPTQHEVLPLLDPACIQEVFAHELSGLQLRKDGTCHFTFAVIRPKHSVPGTGVGGDDERVVTVRLVMPQAGAAGVAQALSQLQKAILLNQAASDQSTPN